jgi:hypothetical protein
MKIVYVENEINKEHTKIHYTYSELTYISDSLTMSQSHVPEADFLFRP